MTTEIRIEHFPLKQETNLIIGIGIEIHKIPGHGFWRSFIRMLLNMNLKSE
jgi:hypothetical protein